jgi:hypothetical protein
MASASSSIVLSVFVFGIGDVSLKYRDLCGHASNFRIDADVASSAS